MNFVADASVARPLIDLLRHRGHGVFAISEIRPDMPDEGVLRVAFSEEAILITEDKDFGELVIRQGHPTHGVILLRLSNVGRRSVRLLPAHKSSALWIGWLAQLR